MFAHGMAADVYDALLGKPLNPGSDDFVKSMQREVKRMQEESAAQSADRTTLTLPLPLDRYVGSYTSEQWGTLEVVKEGDSLRGHIGALPFALVQNESGEIHANSPLSNQAIRFSGSGELIDKVQIGDPPETAMAFVRGPSS